jgi:hypothetical protein
MAGQDDLVRIKAEEWFRTKIKNSSCSLCQTNSWTIADDLVQLFPFKANEGLVLGGRVYPCVMLMCINCGHTILVNAVKAGLVETAAPTSAPSATTDQSETK